MCLSINIKLIFLSCICISKFGLGENKSRQSIISDQNDCLVKMPLVNAEKMPLPYEGNFDLKVKLMFYDTIRKIKPHPANFKVIRPDKNGYLVFKHNKAYKFTCAENALASPTRYPVNEVMVKCMNGYFQYEGKAYEFSKFICKKIPQPSLVSTERKCQGEIFHEIQKVGFESLHTFLNSYRICFDTWYKRTLYAWYFMSPPYYEYNQISKLKPIFVKSREFAETEPREVYENQTITLKETFKRDDLLDVYKEKNPKTPFLIPAPLVSEHEFAFIAEQHSTYFYENTAPQWISFYNDVWNNFQKVFRRFLVNSTSRHLVVTGTILASSLNNTSYDEKNDLYLILPYSFAIPEYFWKMDYNLDKKSGIVFIGVNNPFKKTDAKNHICDPIPCPGRSLSAMDEKSELLYCCTKKSFEKAYGEIDSNVYIEF